MCAKNTPFHVKFGSENHMEILIILCCTGCVPPWLFYCWMIYILLIYFFSLNLHLGWDSLAHCRIQRKKEEKNLLTKFFRSWLIVFYVLVNIYSSLLWIFGLKRMHDSKSSTDARSINHDKMKIVLRSDMAAVKGVFIHVDLEDNIMIQSWMLHHGFQR